MAAFGALIGGTFPLAVIFGLADVAGGLSQSADAAAWVTTVYNVGQVAGQPLLMILVGAFGRGGGMRIAGVGFVLASLSAALAPELGSMLAARLFQGLFGGMLPTLMMLLVMTSPLPGRTRVVGLAAFSLSASIGVGLGAPVAAELIALMGWRGLLWGQVAAGVVYVLFARQVLNGEMRNLGALKGADWPSYALLTVGLGLLALALGEGERHFWLDAWWVAASLACGLVATALALAGLRKDRPLLRLEVFRKPTFTWAIILQLLFRFGLMSAILLAPQFLARLQGYRVEQVALVAWPLALATLAAAPVAYWMTVRLDPRLSLTLGLSMFGLAAAICTTVTSQWASRDFMAPMALVGAGQAFFGIATLRFATFDIAPPQGPTVGVMFNFARIFGLASGLAMASHTLVEAEKFHSAWIAEGLTGPSPLVAERLAGQGAAGLARAATAQAYTLGFADAFALIAGAMILAVILVWALPRLAPIPRLSS